MTLILELPGELGAHVERAQAQREDAAQKRRDAAAEGLGMFAKHGSSVNECLAEPDAEALAETEKSCRCKTRSFARRFSSDET